VDQLEDWSKALVKPLIEGTIALIRKSQDELIVVKKWDGFQRLIDNATKLLDVDDKKTMDDLYAVLKALTKESWGNTKGGLDDLTEARQLNELYEMPFRVQNNWVGGLVKTHPTLVSVASKHRLTKGDMIKSSQSKPSKNRQTGEWGEITDSNFTEGNEAREDAKKIEVFWPMSQQTYHSNTNLSYFRRRKKLPFLFKKLDTDNSGTVDVDEFVTVSTNDGRARNAFSEADKGKNYELDLAEFAEAMRLVQERDIFKGWAVVLADARRRMAQREFSDKRDSPVMIRLLKQIAEAN